jgi:hypothetical protein
MEDGAKPRDLEDRTFLFGEHWTPSDQGSGAALEMENFDESHRRVEEIKNQIRGGAIRNPLLQHGCDTGPGCQQSDDS